jgi:serine/threonine protein kinase
MATELEIGQLLDGRFQITSLISRGSMAWVFEAIDRRSEGRVALKVPYRMYEGDPTYFFRFQQEETIGKSLDHPSILRILPMENKSRPYIVMERLEGKQISELITAGRPMPMAQALGLAASIARALEYLHSKNVIHRDLKPANIMLCKDGSLRVIDLGLAKIKERPGTPIPGFSHPQGTPDYMPPEQVSGREGDGRSDLYSLGAILYEMVTGRTPFPGSDPTWVMHARVLGDPVAPSRLNPALPPQVEEIILHAMERDPKDRYASATEFREELEHPEKVVVTGRAARLLPPSPWGIRWRRSRDFVWTLGIILAVIALFGLAIMKLGTPRRSAQRSGLRTSLGTEVNSCSIPRGG